MNRDDVIYKVFPHSLFGYDPVAVDAFLDEVIREFDRLNNTIDVLSFRLTHELSDAVKVNESLALQLEFARIGRRAIDATTFEPGEKEFPEDTGDQCLADAGAESALNDSENSIDADSALNESQSATDVETVLNEAEIAADAEPALGEAQFATDAESNIPYVQAATGKEAFGSIDPNEAKRAAEQILEKVEQD